jgi:hypothetical protein
VCLSRVDLLVCPVKVIDKELAQALATLASEKDAALSDLNTQVTRPSQIFTVMTVVICNNDKSDETKDKSTADLRRLVTRFCHDQSVIVTCCQPRIREDALPHLCSVMLMLFCCQIYSLMWLMRHERCCEGLLNTVVPPLLLTLWCTQMDPMLTYIHTIPGSLLSVSQRMGLETAPSGF